MPEDQEKKLHTAEDVVKELDSGYGDTMSAIKPYKDVLGASVRQNGYDTDFRDVTATVSVRSEHQSPYGDNATYDVSFTLNRAEMRRLAEMKDGAPRHDFWNDVVAMELRFSELQEKFRAAAIGTLQKGIGEAAPAPAPAAFPKKKFKLP